MLSFISVLMARSSLISPVIDARQNFLNPADDVTKWIMSRHVVKTSFLPLWAMPAAIAMNDDAKAEILKYLLTVKVLLDRRGLVYYKQVAHLI